MILVVWDIFLIFTFIFNSRDRDTNKKIILLFIKGRWVWVTYEMFVDREKKKKSVCFWRNFFSDNDNNNNNNNNNKHNKKKGKTF